MFAKFLYWLFPSFEPRDKWGDRWLVKATHPSDEEVDNSFGKSGRSYGPEAAQRTNSVLHNKCPFCGKRRLMNGPRGGMNQNILCGACGAKFNETSFFGYSHVDLLRGPTDPIPELKNQAATIHPEGE